jgi:hypothetical protein
MDVSLPIDGLVVMEKIIAKQRTIGTARRSLRGHIVGLAEGKNKGGI